MEHVQVEQCNDDDPALSSPDPAPRPIPSASDAIQLPGYGLPLDYLPPKKDRFPVLLHGDSRGWKARTLLIREVCMLKFMEDITNKPEWCRKVRDPKVANEWKREVLALNWDEYRRYGDFTENMAEACIQELRKKATLYEETGLVPVFDYSTCIIKSDTILCGSLLERLKSAVKLLEEVPNEEKDWHPGSSRKVLDLVHPSLFPLLYGRSRIMRHVRVTLNESLSFCGRGFRVPKPAKIENTSFDWRGREVGYFSRKFQWLPCDVTIDDEGNAKIESYINNLHPEKHSDLYPIIEGLVQKSLPAWDLIYCWVRKYSVLRLTKTTRKVGDGVPVPDIVPEVHEEEIGGEKIPSDGQPDTVTTPEVIEPASGSEGDEEEESEESDGSDDSLDSDDEEYDSEDDVACDPSPYFKVSSKDVKHSGFFDNAPRIQVIVKLANIQLTPENPSYDGGSWHIEGQLNEHIVATALFYYDSSNITDSYLAFRTEANKENLSERIDYEQYDWDSIEKIFALDAGFHTMQDIGSVLTRSGRALFFPNLCQHKVQPFELEDDTKNGHRKIVALFLVDPAISVISTSNIPPQQKHWLANGESQAASGDNLNVSNLISMREAKRVRKKLMAERTVMQENEEQEMNHVEWSFCEH